jgi:hypothetical protein
VRRFVQRAQGPVEAAPDLAVWYSLANGVQEGRPVELAAGRQGGANGDRDGASDGLGVAVRHLGG